MPIEVSKIDFDRVVDFLIYENHYVFIKKLILVLGEHNCNFICRRCLSSYESQTVSLKQKRGCNQQEITSIGTSNESHLFWKKHLHENPLNFENYADFEVDNEIDNSSIGKKTTNI